MEEVKQKSGLFAFLHKKPGSQMMQKGDVQQAIQVEGPKSQEVSALSVYSEPVVVSEKMIWNHNHIFIAFFVGILVIFGEVVSIYVLNLSTTGAIILGLSLLLVYGVALFFLLEPRILREVRRTEVRTLEKPVFKEVIVEKPVIKEVIKEVEKPVVREVYVERPIYLESRRKKLVIPHYKFIASSLTKTYHTSNCRLGKSIKRKYKIHNNNMRFFIKKLYRPCEACILKRKKV